MRVLVVLGDGAQPVLVVDAGGTQARHRGVGVRAQFVALLLRKAAVHREARLQIQAATRVSAASARIVVTPQVRSIRGGGVTT